MAEPFPLPRNLLLLEFRLERPHCFNFLGSLKDVPCRKSQTMHIKSFAVALLASLSLASSAFAARQTDEKHTKVGNATYYGDRWHGRRTADGSAYNKDSLTCAHRTLPFGTLLHVRNPKNGKVVVVKVTDRGPYRRNTIIDLSKAAAQQIDMVQAGVVSVEVTPVVNANAPTKTEKTMPTLPELQLLDPTTGRYYTMTQWQERAEKRKELAKNSSAKQPQKLLAKKAAPRYRVKNSAKMANAKKR